MTKAEEAVVHILQRVRDDPRLAYYIGPCTSSLAKLTAAYAAMTGQDHAAFQAEFERDLRTEAPR